MTNRTEVPHLTHPLHLQPMSNGAGFLGFTAGQAHQLPSVDIPRSNTTANNHETDHHNANEDARSDNPKQYKQGSNETTTRVLDERDENMTCK